MSTLHYKYDEQGRKIKGITEYPVIGKSKVTVFSYKNNLLERKVEYDELGRKLTYTDYEYDETGLLTKETIRDPETSEVLRYSEYRNENGLNMEIMVYTSLPTEKKPIELRRITKSYDQNGNLHQLVSEELASSSSQSSFSESYEVYLKAFVMTLFDMECHHECFFLRIGCLFVQSLFVRISGLHEIPLYNKTPSVVVLTPCTFPSVI